MTDVRKINHFFCYSKQLSDFIINKGYPYVTKAHRRDDKMFTLFVCSNELDVIINDYNKNIKE